MLESILIKNQVKKITNIFTEDNIKYKIIVMIRFDDKCNNGHNTFSITSDIYEQREKKYYWVSGGCRHEEIEKHCPELKKYLKWHLCSTDGPIHYIANTTYWANEGNLKYARSTAIWPDATLNQLKDENQLKKRLPKLMLDFKTDMEELGFEY